jgi:hypothetical protein
MAHHTGRKVSLSPSIRRIGWNACSPTSTIAKQNIPTGSNFQNKLKHPTHSQANPRSDLIEKLHS